MGRSGATGRGQRRPTRSGCLTVRGLFASPLGFLIGVSLGALGGGGSILAVPALVYGAGQSPKAATTTSLLIVGLSALTAMWAHWRRGNVRVRMGVIFGVVGIGGSFGGSRLNESVDPDLLLVMFAALMVVAAWRMWAQARRPAAVATPEPAEAKRGATRPIDLKCAAKVVVAGTFIGFLTGFFGVGGGFVIVPSLVLALGLPMPEAVGTSLLVISLNSVFALGQRVSTTGIEWRIAAPFAVAALIGVSLGRLIVGRVDTGALTKAFAALLIGVAGLVVATSL